MKQITVKSYTFNLDDEDFELLKDKKFCVDDRTSSPKLRLTTGKYVHRIIIKTNLKLKPKDGNWCNLVKSNLIEIINDPNYMKQWREKSGLWQKENKDKVNEYRRDRAKNNPEKNSLELKQRYNRLKYKYKTLRNAAKRTNRELNISYEEYIDILSKGCYYTGEPLIDSGYAGYSLDRIDNKKGYTLDNVLPCCGWVNKMRQDHLTVEETKVAVEAILAYRRHITNFAMEMET